MAIMRRKPGIMPLLASTSVLALGLSIAPLSVDFVLDKPILKVAQAECCFTAGTMILMADGSAKPIERVVVGDRVMSRDGGANRVVGVQRPRLGNRELHALNGGRYFVTAEHPFLTPVGWMAIDPEAAKTEISDLKVGRGPTLPGRG